ncbi:putative nucleotide-diphospho-sugar transferase [Psychrobacter aestuarii]|uniref:Nucleotide-diphospho-sugar transferase domain-containing protein n=1 Tax=Psychrobacter aestuarii TaxID=556327 RepID=A0ABP3FMC3_9GAMM|nr:putative nucleotide-diphospho-sugar transferase [Psychrobacter aestuarii]
MTLIPQTPTYQSMSADDRFFVCCFYTDSYLSHALSLKDSLDAFGLNYVFKKVDDAGYWEANTRIKPHFILDCLQQFPDKDVLYLDADALVKKPLDYFNHIDGDVAFYKTKGMAGMSHDYLASTLFFRNTPATVTLVKQWIAEQVDGKRTQVDQDSLDVAMEKMGDSITVTPLSPGYIKIFDKDYDGEIYIEQYQASRGQTKLKRQQIRWRNRLIGGAVIVLAVALVWQILS